jgi:molecular chaperone HscB
MLGVDINTLEKKFHELSRKYHPDYFSTGSYDEKQKALMMTALLNDAYRTLRDPIRRVEYLLSLEGFKPDGSKVPKAFLMEMFEINEQMEEVRSGNASAETVQALRQEIESRGTEFDSQIKDASREWDRLIASGASTSELRAQLGKFTEILSSSSYIRNLERDLEDAV